MKTGTRYLVALGLTAIIFVLGVGVGDYLAGKSVQEVVEAQQALSRDTLAISLQSQLLQEGICEVDVYEITKSKFELGRKIEALEGQKGPGSEQVLELKNTYSLLTLQQYLLVKQKREECGTGPKPVLFFYDNIGAKEDSRTQGYILNYVYKNNPEEVAIFTFSLNVDNPALAALKDKLNVDIHDAPVLVMGGEAYEGVLNSKQIEKILNL